MQRPRTPLKVSESLHQRLNSYALAASAAGVGMLALAQPAEARIEYTKASVEIQPRSRFFLELNHNRGDFKFVNHVTHTYYTGNPFRDNLKIAPQGHNGVWSHAAVLASGVQVGSKGPFQRSSQLMVRFYNYCTRASHSCHTSTIGSWQNISRGYLGLKFFIQGKAHYGWARLNVTVTDKGIYALLTGYAYETVPNKPIITGKTKGPNVITLPDHPSHAHLARGASAIPAPRSRESQ